MNTLSTVTNQLSRLKKLFKSMENLFSFRSATYTFSA